MSFHCTDSHYSFLNTILIFIFSLCDISTFKLSLIPFLLLTKPTLCLPPDKPDPPARVPAASDVRRSCLTLSWYGPTYDGGSAVQSYHLEIWDSVEQQWKTLVSCNSTSYNVQVSPSENDDTWWPWESSQTSPLLEGQAGPGQVRVGGRLGLVSISRKPVMASLFLFSLIEEIYCCVVYRTFFQNVSISFVFGQRTSMESESRVPSLNLLLLD